jgi:hypothetical protein
MENGGREKDFEGRVTYNRRRGETSVAGIKAHTRVQPVSQRRPELISPQLQQKQPAENSTFFTIRCLVVGLFILFFTSIILKCTQELQFNRHSSQCAQDISKPMAFYRLIVVAFWQRLNEWGYADRGNEEPYP